MSKFKDIRVCVVSNKFFDGDYIEEWCEHYYKLGFTYIYILEDRSSSKELFEDMPYIANKIKSGKLGIYPLEKRMNQWDVYPLFYRQHGTEFEWCGIFDSDEFLMLPQHKSIQEYINDPKFNFNEADVIQVNWKIYGDNGHVKKTEGAVVSRFPKPAKPRNSVETKILIRGHLKNVKFYIGHSAMANNDGRRIKFSDGSIIGRMDPFHKTDYTYAALNHYYTKSTEEFIKRKSYGRLDAPQMSRRAVLKGFIGLYFSINERTPEKMKMFEKTLHTLPDNEQAFYSPTAYNMFKPLAFSPANADHPLLAIQRMTEDYEPPKFPKSFF